MLKRTAKIGFHAGRYLLWLLVSMVLLVLLVLALLVSLDTEQYKHILVEKVESATGRQLVIEGGLVLKFSPMPTFHADQVRLANAEWGSRPWMFSAGRVEIQVSPAALLKRELELSEIEVFEPHIWFEKSESGRVNWDMRKPDPDNPTKAKVALGWLFVKALEARDGQVEYAQWGREHLIEFSRLKVRVDEDVRQAKIHLEGAMEERPLEAWGTLSDFDTLVNRQPSAMKLKVHYGDSRATGEGTAQDLLSWEGANIDFNLQLDRLTDLSPLFPFKLPEVGPLSGSAKLEQPGNWRTMEINEIDLVSKQTGLKGRLGGSWIGPDVPSKTALRLAVQGDLAVVLGSINVDSETGLKIDADVRLEGGVEGYQLALDHLELLGEGLLLRSGEVAKELSTAKNAEIPVEAEIESLQKVGLLLGLELPEWGPLSGTARLANREGRVVLDNIKAQITSDLLHAKVEGKIDDLLKRDGGELLVSASAPELKQFEAFKGIKISLPPLTALQLEGAIQLNEGRLHGEVRQLTGGAKGVKLTLAGSIANLIRFGDVQLEAVGEAESLTRLNPLFDIKLPSFGPLNAKGNLVREGEGAFDFRDATATIREKGASMDLRGALLGLGPNMEASFEANLDAANLARFSEVAGFELPEEGPVKASAKVLAAKPESWRIEGLRANLDSIDGRVEVTGEINSLFRSWLPDLSIKVDDLKTAKLADLAKIEIPLSGLVDAKARATRTKGNPMALEEIKANLQGEGLQATASGRLGQLVPFAGLQVEVIARADNVRRIGWLQDAGLQPVGPVNADFNLVSEDGGNRYRIQLHNARLRNSDARGVILWQNATTEGGTKQSKAKPRLDLQLTSEVLDIKTLLPEKPERKGALFDPAPLKTEWINKLNGTWDIRAANFRDEIVEATNFASRMQLDNGKFEVSEMKATLGQGNAVLSLKLDANRQPPPIQLSLSAKNADPTKITKARESDLFVSGTMDLDVEIVGAGSSISELMAGANGQFTGQFWKTKIRMENLDLFAADIFTSLISVINPLAKRSDIANVECAVLNFPIDSGKILTKRGIAIKTDKITLLGGGEIDLEDESLNLVVSPKARKGFGISAGTLAKMVGIAGTITEPKVDTHLKGYLETGAVIGAAIFTSGLTLFAQGLWDRTTANSDVCQLVLADPQKPEVLEREIIPDDAEKR